MYRKNTSGQHLGFLLLNSSSGAALTGATVTAYRSVDGGAQASAGGTVTEIGNGQYSIALAQADTNGNQISFLFTATSAIPVEKTIVTTAADPTNATTFGLTNLANAVPTVAAVATQIWTDTTSSDFTTAGSPGYALARFGDEILTGTVTSSPSPTTTSFTVTLDRAVSGSMTSANFVGLYATIQSGTCQAAVSQIKTANINSTTQVALTFQAAWSQAPAGGDLVSISS